MSDMDVTARFRADISDMQSKMAKLNGLYQDSAGKWRSASGQFATSAQKSAAGIDSLTAATKRSSKGFTVLKGAVASGLGFSAAGAITSVVRGMKNFAMSTVNAAVEARKADDRLTAIATSMGVLDTTLGGSTKRITDFASELQSTTGVSDEVIKQGQALLLTFNNVAKSAGEQGGMFDRATAAAIDLSAAGFGSVEGSSKQLGKALQDPIKGITALSRSGVTFTNAEKEKIKVLTESGKILQAQTMIMSAVETQVGGTAAATMTAGDRMRVAFDEFQETIGKAVLPIIEKIQTFIADKVVPALVTFVEYVKTNIAPVVGAGFDIVRAAVAAIIPYFISIIQKIKELGPLLILLITPILSAVAAFKLFNAVPGILKTVGTAVTDLKKKIIAMNTAAFANPYVLAATAIVAAFALIAVAFKMVYDRSKSLQDAVSKLVDTFKAIVSVVMNDVIGAFTGGSDAMDKAGKSGKSMGDIFEKVADIAGKYLTKYIEFVTGYIKVLANVIRVLIKTWEVLAKIMRMIVGLIKAAVIVTFKAMGAAFNFVMDRLGPLGANFKKVGSIIGSAFGNIGGIVKSAMSGAVSFIENAINTAINAINFLIDTYNKIPFVDNVGNVDPFVISAFQQASGYDAGAANAAVGARYQGMADTGKGYVKKTLKPFEEGPGPGPGGAADKENKALEAVKAKYDKLRETLSSAKTAYQSIASQTESRFGEPSQIIKAFGMEGDVSSVISQYDQLDAALRDYYANLAKSPGLSKKAIKAINTAGTEQRAELTALATRSIKLMQTRKKIQEDLATLDQTYSDSQAKIGADYDALDKEAEGALKSLTEKWDKAIPALEAALASATEAFDKENSVLQSLISERDSFLGAIKSGISSFVNAFSFEGADAAGIKSQLEARLKSVKEFTANIRTLVERGLDPALVQEFVAAGVSGAGEAVAALASGSAGDIAGINAVQSSLASEIAGFQTYASQQWFDAGIAQQEAIVGPLAAARDQAAAALATANATRATELASAQAHIDALKVQRQDALDKAKADYLLEQKVLLDLGKTNEIELTKNATAVQDKFTSLQATMPPEMIEVGKKAINGIIAGINSREQALINRAKEIGEAVKDALEKALKINSPSKVTMKIGEQVAQGLANGMGSGEGMIASSAANLGVSAIPSMASRSGSSVISNTYTVNIQSLSTDKRQIGREVVEAIKAFEKSSGPVYQPASV